MQPQDPASPSSRRAWVEISAVMKASAVYCVALLAEGVGRNRITGASETWDLVALLAEGVGRNNGMTRDVTSRWVALLAEGVGRNRSRAAFCFSFLRRPPRGGRG